MQTTKMWWKSRTIWWNILGILAVLLLTPEVKAVVPPDAEKYLLAVGAVVNIVLRTRTDQAVAA